MNANYRQIKNCDKITFRYEFVIFRLIYHYFESSFNEYRGPEKDRFVFYI